LAFHWLRLFSKNFTSFLLGLLYRVASDSFINDPFSTSKLWSHLPITIPIQSLINNNDEPYHTPLRLQFMQCLQKVFSLRAEQNCFPEYGLIRGAMRLTFISPPQRFGFHPIRRKQGAHPLPENRDDDAALGGFR
jgi:hypothetical protein